MYIGLENKDLSDMLHHFIPDSVSENKLLHVDLN